MKRLRDWIGVAVRLEYPGHPDHGRVGQVVRVKRSNEFYEQRTVVRWEDGEISYVPVANLVAVDR